MPPAAPQIPSDAPETPVTAAAPAGRAPKPDAQKHETRPWDALRRFGPPMGRRRAADILRAAAGAGIGILIATFVVAMKPLSEGAEIYLVSSFASTAVLLFALPNSPLAQPWSALVGMMVSAVVPIAVLLLVPPPWADGLAVAGAIIAMMALRALHPPAAGIALLAVLEYEAGRPLGIGFVLFPVGAITLLLVIFAIGWNRAFGITYPAKPLASRTEAGLRSTSPGRALSQDDLAKLLLEFNQSANLAPADLSRLMAAAEARAAEALIEGTKIGDIMTSAPLSVTPEATMAEIVAKLSAPGVKALPVCDSEGHYLGIIDQNRVTQRLARDLEALRSPLRRLTGLHEAEARDLMISSVRAVTRDTAVGALLERLSDKTTRIVPVTERGRLVGVVTRTDVMVLLLDHAPGSEEYTGPKAPLQAVAETLAEPRPPQTER